MNRVESTGSQRRLATILAADVVGYSKLMAQDEEATVRTLRSHRDIIDKLIARHEGRIFNTAGDAVLAEFGSVVEAVRCAISIQDELRVRNAELVADRQMLFRIGVNVGDVLVNGDDLLGDGVNIAARLEGIAQPGGICISGGTFEQVKNKMSVGFEDLGPQRVKNIPEAISAFAITSAPVSVAGRAGASAGKASSRAAGTTRRRRRIAIAAAASLIVVVGGIGYWQLPARNPVPITSFPVNISTDEMHADEIRAFMSGISISGNRTIDGQPFTIVLNADMTASYQFPRTGELSGTMERITGTWRTEDSRFCLHLQQFAYGREVCPRIEKDGLKLAARARRNGALLPWSLTK
jgi:class 3 adenylate cyclase